jgi:PAS domain S-box-containing protein
MTDPIRVLLVDDDAEFADTAGRMLEQKDSGLDVVTATTPERGLDRFGSTKIDCVVSEHKLPGTDGLAFLDGVRERDPTVPFILFTGRGSERIASRAVSAGVTDYLQKGGEETYELLASRIRAALAERQEGEAVADHPPMELLGRITDAFLALDTEWRFTYVNEAAEEMFGESADELLGERIWDLYPEATETPFYDYYREAMENGQPQTIEQYYEPWDRWYREHIYPSDSGLSIVSHDVTEYKRDREQLERAHIQLESFTAEATPELRDSLESIGEQLEQARAECDSAPLRTAVEEFGRAEALTAHLLTLARCTDTAVETQPIDFPSLAHQCWETVGADRVTLCIDTGRTIRADRTQLRQLLDVLFRNSVEHASPADDSGAQSGAGATVRVTVGATDDGFYVADDGPGISGGDREKVFEPGYSTSPGGTGFGLPVVRQIATAHGWEIRLTESEDGGARFDFVGVEFEE